MHVTHTRRGTTKSFALTACHQRVRTPGFGTAAHLHAAPKPNTRPYPAAVPPAWCYKSRKKKKTQDSNPPLLKKLGGMSGAQGAQPKESLTPTTYESVPTEENKTRLDPRSKEDEGMIKIEKQQDKVEDAAGGGGPVFGAGKEEHKPDLGVTGTG